MPAIFSAQISEYGSYYQVTNVFLEEVKYILPHAKYVALSNHVALALKNQLNQGNQITIEKKLVDEPQSPDIPLEHFNIKQPETLDEKKSELKSKVNQRISAYTALLSGLDLYQFFVVFTKLHSLGYEVLNEQKKEETFLEIINTGNEDLITDLEIFLELKDRFDNILKKYKGIKDYFREIDESETEEELNEVNEGWKGWLIN
jgi:hypothetical protein